MALVKAVYWKKGNELVFDLFDYVNRFTEFSKPLGVLERVAQR